jgi:predicted flap endonuclease-1-like 5' DNA nuclease
MSKSYQSYQPSKSSLRADTVVEFVNQSLLDFKMTDIPGMGPASIVKFQNEGIYTPAQILAKFLSYVDTPDANAIDVCNGFYDWATKIMGQAK